MHLGAYLATIRKRWISVAAITLVVFGLAAGYTFTQAEVFTASTQNFVALTGDSADGSSPLSGAQFAAQRVRSYVDIVSSPEVLEPVVQELDLPYTAQQLSGKVSATNPSLTVMLVVSAMDSNPVQAAEIANAVSVQLGRTIKALETPTATSTSPVKVTLTDPATPPGAPSSPQTRLNLAIGLILGLALGLAWAHLREALDNTVFNPTELEKLTDAPLLGAVVQMGDNQNAALSALDATNVNSEGYRTVDTNLRFVSVDEQLRAVVITSAEQGDGKSTLSCNLAITIAQSGKAVCLVEADLRRPQICEYLGVDRGIGLTDVLAGDRTLDETIRSWGRGLLSVLPAGPIPPNPVQLLGSHQLQNVLADLAARFDVIILDSAPLLSVSDAAILAAQTDGAILVVRHGESNKAGVVRAIGALEQVNAELLGIVLNGVPAKRHYGYGYGYGYGQTKPDRKSKKRAKSDATHDVTPTSATSPT